MDVRGYETPEEAVLAELDVPRRYFNVVGVRVCGDEAWVYLLTNDRPAYAEYTCVCFREQGLWTEAYGGSGFSPPVPSEVRQEAERVRSRFR